MGLFGFGKKKKEESCDCGGCCGAKSTGDIGAQGDEKGVEQEHFVKVLGSGCKKCNDLENAAKSALASLGQPQEVEHVTDFTKIAEFGVMTTPALVIGDEVVSTGKVLKPDEIVGLLKNRI